MTTAAPAPTEPVATSLETNGDLLGGITSTLEETLALQAAMQQAYLDYQVHSEGLRIVSEAVQKSLDVSENERQDISQSQE